MFSCLMGEARPRRRGDNSSKHILSNYNISTHWHVADRRRIHRQRPRDVRSARRLRHRLILAVPESRARLETAAHRREGGGRGDVYHVSAAPRAAPPCPGTARTPSEYGRYDPGRPPLLYSVSPSEGECNDPYATVTVAGSNFAPTGPSSLACIFRVG